MSDENKQHRRTVSTTKDANAGVVGSIANIISRLGLTFESERTVSEPNGIITFEWAAEQATRVAVPRNPILQNEGPADTRVD